MNHYKGFAGAVKSIQCSFHGSEDSEQLFSACGFDRYLRVYTIQPPKLIHQVHTCHVLIEIIGITCYLLYAFTGVSQTSIQLSVIS